MRGLIIKCAKAFFMDFDKFTHLQLEVHNLVCNQGIMPVSQLDEHK